MKTIIFAGERCQAEVYAREHGLARQDFFYLDSPEKLRGLEGPLRNPGSEWRFQTFGTWWNRDDCGRVRENAIICGFDPGF